MNEKRMQESMQNAIDHRLSGLEGNPYLARRIIDAEEGEKPIMKKKLSVSLALVLALMLLTAGAALALTHSRIAEHLFGGNENIPKDMEEMLLTPQVTEKTTLGVLSIDELLYDGSALHSSFTIANPTGETLLYTLEGIWINGNQVLYDGMITEGAWDNGFLLGGSAEGRALPESYSLYNRAEQVYRFSEDGKYQGLEALPQGEATLKIAYAVWRPLGQVERVDYAQYEGMDISETRDHLTVGENGIASLWLFLPEEYSISCKANESGARACADIYRELGWAEWIDVVEAEMQVTLDAGRIHQARPESMEYELAGVKITLEQFSLTHAGGSISGRMDGAEADIRSLMKSGLALADRQGNRLLSSGCIFEEKQDGVHFTLSLLPIAEELPKEIDLAPIIAMDGRWDESRPCYDPNPERPDGVIGETQMDFEKGIRIELETGF